MILIEKSTTGKQSQETCEDGAVVTADYVAVIDGSTSKALRQARSDMRNGRLAMLVLADAIEHAPAQANCKRFCQWVTEAFRKAHDLYNLDESLLSSHPENRLTASVAVYSNHHKEVWMIGDCQCMVDGVLYENPKPAEAPNAEKRANVILQLLESGRETVSSLRKHDIGRDAIISAIIDSCNGQNKTFSVVDGTPIAMEFVRVIPTSSSHEIVLATDGYPCLKPSLAESEDLLAEIIEKDPLLIGKYKATKAVMEGNLSFDDRCYVRFYP